MFTYVFQIKEKHDFHGNIISSLSSLEMNGVFKVINVVRGTLGDICLDDINRLNKTKQLFH